MCASNINSSSNGCSLLYSGDLDFLPMDSVTRQTGLGTSHGSATYLQTRKLPVELASRWCLFSLVPIGLLFVSTNISLSSCFFDKVCCAGKDVLEAFGAYTNKQQHQYQQQPRYLFLRRRRRRSGIAGAGLSLYARLISHFNITNMVFNYI